MKDKRATTAIFLNKWRPNKEGKCPVSIRVTYNGVKRYYPTEFSLTLENPHKLTPFFRTKLTPQFRSKLTPLIRSKLTPLFLPV